MQVQNHSEILRQIKQTIATVDPAATVILFGSRARGDYNDESDWDVLVLMDKEENDWQYKQLLRKRIYKLELQIGQVLSSVICNRDFWKKELAGSPLYQEINKHGVPL